MNERIRELAAQAIDYFCDNEKSKIMDEKVLENFAESIVGVCMCKVAGYLLEDEFGNQDVKEASEELAKHFGIK